MTFLCGAPGGIRTPGLKVRSLALYPAKLQVHAHTIITTLYDLCKSLEENNAKSSYSGRKIEVK